MKLSIDTYSIVKRFGEEKAYSLIKEAGFDCVDYSFYWLSPELQKTILGDDYIAHAYQIRKFLDKIALSCNQAHAPFDFNIKKDTMDLSNKNFENIVKSMEIASILGADNIVVHALNPLDDETVFDTNFKFYSSLKPYCEKFKIHIAIENLFGPPYDNETKKYLGNRFARPEDMKELISAIDSEWFVCCVDVGHATITGIEPQDYIYAMNSATLKALHIQDNDYKYDRHILPYMGNIDWDKVAASLKAINYTGELTFEIFGFLDKIDDELIADTLKFAEKIGRHIIKKIEG